MAEIGVRDLKLRASDVLRRVREEGESFTVTYRGRAVARLVPVDRAERGPADLSGVWTEMDRLAGEIGASWPEGVSASDAVGEQRRAS